MCHKKVEIGQGMIKNNIQVFFGRVEISCSELEPWPLLASPEELLGELIVVMNVEQTHLKWWKDPGVCRGEIGIWNGTRGYMMCIWKNKAFFPYHQISMFPVGSEVCCSSFRFEEKNRVSSWHYLQIPDSLLYKDEPSMFGLFWNFDFRPFETRSQIYLRSNHQRNRPIWEKETQD